MRGHVKVSFERGADIVLISNNKHLLILAKIAVNLASRDQAK